MKFFSTGPVTAIFILTGGLLNVSVSSENHQEEFSPYSERIPGADVEIEMVPVAGGIFMMGSPESEPGRKPDEGPRRRVKVDSFWMGRYEITWEQYDLFARDRMDEILAGYSDNVEGLGIAVDAMSLPTPPYVDMSFGMGREGYPAISMTHYAAVMFTKWLTIRTGTFYRLPTEAEWEYACRAGAGTPYHFGDRPEQLDDYGWHYGNSGGSYNLIGQKQPNAFGLHDMHGNIAEWTMDQYAEDYFERLAGGDVAGNPWIRPTQLYPRSVRGGSWRDDPAELRCAARRGSAERWKMLDPQLPKSRWWHTSAPFVGFRIVRPAEPPSSEEMERYWIEAMDDY